MTFSCPLWIHEILCRKKNKSGFIIEALTREINTNSNVFEKIKQLKYKAKEKIKEIYEIQQEIKDITPEQTE